jgi:uncharacterized membrane protein YgcG
MRRLLGAFVLFALWVVPAVPAQADTNPDTYLDTVAGKLAEPGVWVDPGVKQLKPDDVAALNAAVRSSRSPIRIAVVPAAQIRSTSGYLEWTGEEIAAQLHDRVGRGGVYAVLVDAGSESAGRGFHAVQKGSYERTYHVRDAVNAAVDCCAPDYYPMLSRFISTAQGSDTPVYLQAIPYVGGLAALFALWFAIAALMARRTRRQDEKAHLAITRPMLDEEITDLSQRVVALPPTTDLQQSALAKQVHDTVELARRQLGVAEGDADVEALTALLDSARYGLHCLDELRSGRRLPEPAAPCFCDPRHGPSTAAVDWRVGPKRTRQIGVCAACKERDDAGDERQVRTVTLWRMPRPYWEFGEDLGAYVDGYWLHHGWFPDSGFRRKGNEMRARWRAVGPRARFGRFSSKVGTSVGNAAVAFATAPSYNRRYGRNSWDDNDSFSWSSSSSSSGGSSGGGDSSSGSRGF